ncbi:hypothetical protein BDV11DRAFT_201045, partial [Aspergillus similis]
MWFVGRAHDCQHSPTMTLTLLNHHLFTKDQLGTMMIHAITSSKVWVLARRLPSESAPLVIRRVFLETVPLFNEKILLTFPFPCPANAATNRIDITIIFPRRAFSRNYQQESGL